MKKYQYSHGKIKVFVYDNDDHRALDRINYHIKVWYPGHEQVMLSDLIITQMKIE
jgi:hypothetical protein